MAFLPQSDTGMDGSSLAPTDSQFADMLNTPLPEALTPQPADSPRPADTPRDVGHAEPAESPLPMDGDVAESAEYHTVMEVADQSQCA